MAKVEILALAAGLPRTDLAGNPLGPVASARAVVQELFPGRVGASLPAADLLTASYPQNGRIYAGIFGPSVVVCGQDLIELTDLAAVAAPMAQGRTVFRLQLDSAIDSVALEILAPDGESVRELMLVAADGVIFDVGPHLNFEQPFWSGDRDPERAFAAVNGAEMPFDVVDFGDAAVRTLFGFGIDDDPAIDDLDTGHIVLHGFVMTAGSADPADPTSVRRSTLSTPSPMDLGAAGEPGRPPAAAAVMPPDQESTEVDKGHRPWWQRMLDRLFLK